MIFNLVWLPARQIGSSTWTKVLLRIMLRDTTVCEDDLVKQALSRGVSNRSVRSPPRPKCREIHIPVLNWAIDIDRDSPAGRADHDHQAQVRFGQNFAEVFDSRGHWWQQRNNFVSRDFGHHQRIATLASGNLIEPIVFE